MQFEIVQTHGSKFTTPGRRHRRRGNRCSTATWAVKLLLSLESVEVRLLCKHKITGPLLDQPSGRSPALCVFRVVVIASVDGNNSNGDEAYTRHAYASIGLFA